MLEATVAAAPLPTPSAASNTTGRQASGTRQQDEDTGRKHVLHPKKTEEASQCAPDKLLQDGWDVKMENTLAKFQRARREPTWQV